MGGAAGAAAGAAVGATDASFAAFFGFDDVCYRSANNKQDNGSYDDIY